MNVINLFGGSELPDSATMAEIAAALAQTAPTIRELNEYALARIRYHREHPGHSLTSVT